MLGTAPMAAFCRIKRGACAEPDSLAVGCGGPPHARVLAPVQLANFLSGTQGKPTTNTLASSRRAARGHGASRKARPAPLWVPVLAAMTSTTARARRTRQRARPRLARAALALAALGWGQENAHGRRSKIGDTAPALTKLAPPPAKIPATAARTTKVTPAKGTLAKIPTVTPAKAALTKMLAPHIRRLGAGIAGWQAKRMGGTRRACRSAIRWCASTGACRSGVPEHLRTQMAN